MREDIRADLRTIGQGASLKPDVVIERSGRMAPGGHVIDVHLARDAVTAGDVWLYDEASRVAVLGDLVTLPAPFLDTACPEGWRHALAEVGAVPFEVAIPGHGAPMNLAQFEQYQRAFAAFIESLIRRVEGGEGNDADLLLSIALRHPVGRKARRSNLRARFR